MKKILFSALAASFLFACSEQEVTDNNETAPGGDGVVTLSIQQIPQVKGITNQKGDTEYAVIGSAKIFFLNGADVNVYSRELSTNEINSIANSPTTAGNKTITITGVPNTATSLYFVANVQTGSGTSFPPIEGSNASNARLRIDKLQGNAQYAPMAGLSSTFLHTTGNQYTTSVVITPLVARLEIGQVTCQNQNGAGQPAVSTDITGYTLAGVFINNIRPYVLLQGTPYLTDTPVNIKGQPSWSTAWDSYFMPSNAHFPYYNGGSPSGPTDWLDYSMVDYCTTSDVGLTFYPTASTGATSSDPGDPIKQAWAFQICPSEVPTSGSAIDIPHIILKLTNVTYQSNEYGLPIQFVTVTKYKTEGGVAITQFERGKVYRIKNLIFTHNEATNEPYETNISVTATISVTPWTINNIVPDFN